MNKDLISRSALLGGYDVRKVTEYDESGCGLEYNAVSVEAIEAAPAVDAEAVRHGRWEWRGGIPWCSNCGEMLNGYSYENNINTIPYCPNCGAKMDGDVNGQKTSD